MIRKFKIILFLFFSFACQAQEYIYKEFGFNDGLPSSQVYDMYQDKNGIIWFATDRGISSYNGYEFKNYGQKEGVLNNVIIDFYPQENGRVYCNTINNELFYFNEVFNGFIAYEYNDLLKKNIVIQFISSIYEDAKNNLYIRSDVMDGRLVISKKGLIIQDQKNTKPIPKEKIIVIEERHNKQPLFYYNFSGKESTKNKVQFSTDVFADVNVISLNGSEKIVIKDDIAVYVYNQSGTLIKTIKNEFRPLIIKPINESSFFVGYLFGGGKIIDSSGNILEEILEGQSVTRMLVDNEGGYWFSTLYSGVFYVKDPRIKLHKNEMFDVTINSLTKNNKNELYIGYDNGQVAKIDKNNHYSIEYSSPIKKVAFVEFDAPNKHLIVNSGGVTYKDTKDNLLDFAGHTTKLSEPYKNKIIVSQPNRLIVVDQTKKTNKIIDVPNRAHDACFWNDDIYFSSPIGVFLYKKGKIYPLAEKNSLFKNRIDDIDYNENRNEIYFATLGSGIIVYNKNTEIIYTITKSDGLLSNVINEIYIENKNEIWVCTNSGLNRIRFNQMGGYSITGLKSSNGLLNDGITDVQVIGETVWIASKKGLVYAPKNIFDTPKKTDNFFLRIKEFKVNNGIVSSGSLTDLSYKENRIEFFAEGVSFKKSNDLVYKYKLVGLDDKWYSTLNRKIVYSALPYGEYIFKIGVTTSNKNNPAKFIEIPISIKPPFWKRSWFVVLCVLLLSGVIYLFFKIRVFSYNKDITRELMRLMMKKFKRKDNYFIFKEAGKDIRVRSNSILYIKSAGNYIELYTDSKTYVVRCKIGDFIDSTPDPLEFVRIHRSYIVRIDKVETKSKSEVTINGITLPVSLGYESEMAKLIF